MANQLPPGQQQIYDHFEDDAERSDDDDAYVRRNAEVLLFCRAALRFSGYAFFALAVVETLRMKAPLLDISLLVAGGLFLPIRLPCFFPGVMEHSPACLRWLVSLAHPMTEHVFLIDMGKNLTLVLLCAWAYLQTSVASKKAVATLMSIQNLWAAFVAHGLASPEMPGEPYLKRVFGQPVVVIDCLGPAALMVAAILTAPDAKAGKKK